MTKPTFEEWLGYTFLQRADEFEGVTQSRATEAWESSPADELLFIDRLFSNPVEHTRRFSDSQINRGLWLLINFIEPDLRALFDENIAFDIRVRVVQNMYIVFRDLFAPRCSPSMSSYGGKADASQLNPLNSICYMWWDIIPLHGKSGDRIREALDIYCLEVMRQTLQLKSIACQEGALHGFGHWARAYPTFVRTAIDEFFEANPHIDSDLREYALDARTGGVL